MALEVDTGYVVKPSSWTPNLTNVISLSFTPKAVILWAIYEMDNSVSPPSDGDVSWCMGFSDGTNEECIAGSIEDGQGTSNTGQRYHQEALMAINTFNGTRWRVNATFQTDQLTLTYFENSPSTTKVHWMAFGGDDITGVQVDHFNKATSTGVQSVTCDSDVRNITEGNGVVFFLNHSVQQGEQFGANDHQLGFGAATGTAAGEQFAIGLHSEDGAGTSNENVASYDDSCIVGHTTSGGIERRAQFDGFDSLGFDVDWVTADGDNDEVPFMIIKGGNWQVGTDTMRTSNGSKQTSTDFQPEGLFCFGVNRTSNGNGAANSTMMMGGATGASNESVLCGGAEDGSGSSDAAASYDHGATVQHIDTNTANLIVEAALTSFDAAPGFTLNYSNTDSAYDFGFIVCADEAAAGYANKVMGVDGVGKVYGVDGANIAKVYGV